ncbi:MBL fold metallo-hydrolase [Streptomyces sp. NPDC056500]|uniref:MBL fold metallo-hydrolase n=1 Tax=Streptomyces sp. NPDC056500 TaxID=3345840 RepID=UPI0036A013F4
MSAATALPVADRWYTVTPVDESLTLIQEPHVDPLLSANTWHLRGTRHDLLIDAGLGVASLRDALPDLFGEREPVVVLTHAHLDHMGSAHEFAECWAHPAEPVDTPGRGSLLARVLNDTLGGDPDEAARLPPVLINALPTEDYDPLAYRLRPVSITRQLEEGDTIDLGDRQLRVLHLPGHTPGSIGLYDEGRRVLFSGDVLYDDELLDTLEGSDIGQYIATMKRLRRLDVDLVHAGHGASFGAERMREIIDAYLLFRGGQAPPETLAAQ